MEALEAAVLVLRNVSDGDEDGHAALEQCELVFSRAQATLCRHGHELGHCLHRVCLEAELSKSTREAFKRAIS